MLDFINQLQKKMKDNDYKWCRESSLARFKILLADLAICKTTREYEHQEILHFLELVRKINFRLRSFGVYKVKNRKQWKLSDECLNKFILNGKLIGDYQNEGVENSCS